MMPRYYFDICDGHGRIEDDEGTDCRDLTAALREADASARDLIKQFIDTDWPLAVRRIEIRDENGSIVARMPVASALGKPH